MLNHKESRRSEPRNGFGFRVALGRHLILPSKTRIPHLTTTSIQVLQKATIFPAVKYTCDRVTTWTVLHNTILALLFHDVWKQTLGPLPLICMLSSFSSGNRMFVLLMPDYFLVLSVFYPPVSSEASISYPLLWNCCCCSPASRLMALPFAHRSSSPSCIT